jgi:hypothetical protein
VARARRRPVRRLDEPRPEVRRVGHALGRGRHVEADDDRPRPRPREGGVGAAGPVGRLPQTSWAAPRSCGRCWPPTWSTNSPS